jgi:4-alpha-glucanotransferase
MNVKGMTPSAQLTLEDGTVYGGKLKIRKVCGRKATLGTDAEGVEWVSSVLKFPADIPAGYHTLHVVSGTDSSGRTLETDAYVIAAPAKVELPPVSEHRQLWGWMAQLYSIRSHQSWGVGDFADLRQMMSDSASKTKADYILINPVHAAEPVSPLTPSPYLPDSRLQVNFTYVRPENIAEFASLPDDVKAKIASLHESVLALNDDVTYVDRDAMWKAKGQALRAIFDAGRSADRQAVFDEFKRDRGDALDGYATWCVAYEVWGAPAPDDSTAWVHQLAKDSDKVIALVKEHADDIEFYRWLEWVVDEQLDEVQKAANAQGMPLGLMMDMAVGTHPDGADVWWNPERYAKAVTVGAPPDFYNQLGQDWSQPPLNPVHLESTGFKVFRDQIHQILSHAGAVRIDHILGLFRLWWIPQGNLPLAGTYVNYNYEAMLAVLTIEAMRAGAVVIGEDLGVVPSMVAGALKEHGILGSVIEWFQQKDGEFVDPRNYREYAIASVTTHDLPPTAGYLNYESVTLREKLGLLETPVEEFRAVAEKEHKAMLDFLVKGGWLDASALADEAAHEQEIIEAMHKVLLASPSRLICAAIVDGVGERRTQNQPGTNNEYPNWRIPLADGDLNPVYCEELFDNPRVQSLAKIMRGGKEEA